jgi:hypothetical protein
MTIPCKVPDDPCVFIIYSQKNRLFAGYNSQKA